MNAERIQRLASALDNSERQLAELEAIPASATERAITCGWDVYRSDVRMSTETLGYLTQAARGHGAVLRDTALHQMRQRVAKLRAELREAAADVA